MCTGALKSRSRGAVVWRGLMAKRGITRAVKDAERWVYPGDAALAEIGDWRYIDRAVGDCSYLKVD